MNCRRSRKFSVQVWISAFACILSFLVGLGQVAYGTWLILHYTMVAGLVGSTLIYVNGAFAGCGGFASLIALFGILAFILRRRQLVIFHVVMTVLSILAVCVIWAVAYIEQRKVATELPGRLLLAENVQYYKFIDYQYNCNLQNVTADQLKRELFQSCASFLTRQSWTRVYALLGLCGALICVQSVVVLMGGMMSRLLKNTESRTHPVRASNPLALDLTHTNQQAIVQAEDISCISDVTSMEMTVVQPSAPLQESQLCSLPQIPPPPTHHASSPPFYAQDGFALHPNAQHNWGNCQRQPSITQL